MNPFQVLYLALYLTLLSFTAHAAEVKPYSIFTVKRTRPTPSMNPTKSCKALFSKENPGGLFVEFESATGGGIQTSIAPGRHEPAYHPRGSTLRISRFFKIHLPTYAGYWRWKALNYPLEGEPLGQKMHEVTDHFMDRWIQDFSMKAKKVNQIREINKSRDPLRQTHIGLRMGDVPWGGIVLFDGSSTLFNFNSEKGMTEVKGQRDNRSDLEVRYPDLLLPERTLQEEGVNIKLFFLGMLTSLPEVSKAVHSIYSRVAVMLLLKINAKRVTSQHNKFDEKTIYSHPPQFLNRAGVHVLNGGDSFPIQQANKLASIDSLQMGPSIYSTKGVRLYATATQKMIEFHQEYGWKVMDDVKEDVLEPGMKIIYYDVYDFIHRFLSLEKTAPKSAETTKIGETSKEYKAEEMKEVEAWNYLINAINRREQARRSLFDDKPKPTDKGKNSREYLDEKKREEDQPKYGDGYG